MNASWKPLSCPFMAAAEREGATEDTAEAAVRQRTAEDVDGGALLLSAGRRLGANEAAGEAAQYL